MQHAVEVETDSSPQPDDADLFQDYVGRRPSGQNAIDRFMASQPLRLGVRFVVPDARVMWPGVVPARQAQPVAIMIPGRLVGEDLRLLIEPAALEVRHQFGTEFVHARRAHRLGKDDEQVKSADAVGIHQQRVQALLDQHLLPAANGSQVSLGRDRIRIVGIVTIDIDRQPARGQIAAGRMDAELARGLPRAEMFAERIDVEKSLAALVAKRHGNDLGGFVALAPNVAPPDIGAIDQVGQHPLGQFRGAVTPLAGNALQVIHAQPSQSGTTAALSTVEIIPPAVAIALRPRKLYIVSASPYRS